MPEQPVKKSSMRQQVLRKNPKLLPLFSLLIAYINTQKKSKNMCSLKLHWFCSGWRGRSHERWVLDFRQCGCLSFLRSGALRIPFFFFRLFLLGLICLIRLSFMETFNSWFAWLWLNYGDKGVLKPSVFVQFIYN